MTEKLDALQEKMTKLKAEMKTEFQKEFRAETDVLFKKYDWLVEISWNQYTPYFNDGDACEFSVNEVVVNGASSSYSDKTKLYDESWSCIKMDEDDVEAFIEKAEADEKIMAEFLEVEEVADTLIGFLQSNESIALAMFDDHVKVSIQADGVYTEELEHD